MDRLFRNVLTRGRGGLCLCRDKREPEPRLRYGLHFGSSNICKAFHEPDNFSRVRSCQGDPARPHPTVRIQTPPGPTRLDPRVVETLLTQPRAGSSTVKRPEHFVTDRAPQMNAFTTGNPIFGLQFTWIYYREGFRGF